jgi:NADH-quinone oxidoreductase subunit L
LIHYYTSVTAGAYLMTRLNDSLNGLLLLISSLIVCITVAGTKFKCFEKIIALSILNQLGLMMRNLSFGFSSLVFFHLLTHALFKTLFFVCAGMITHAMKGSQNMRLISTVPSDHFLFENFQFCFVLDAFL